MKNLGNNLQEVNGKNKQSGLFLSKIDNKLYTMGSISNTLVIGSQGSGKTQTVILPSMRLAIKAEESMVVNDVKGELVNILLEDLKSNNYNVVVIDLDSKNKDTWNPIDLAYQTYKADPDKSIEMLNEICSYILPINNETMDLFWNNSATSLFVGIALNEFKKHSINFRDVANIVSDLTTEEGVKKYLEKVEKNSPAYLSLNGVLSAPMETKNSIIAVLNQAINKYAASVKLGDCLDKSSFDIEKINEEKTAVFIINKGISTTKELVSLFFRQAFDAISMSGSKRRINFLIDEIDFITPIHNINEMLNLARGYNINLVFFTQSLLVFKDTYKLSDLELIKVWFSTIIYLYANDSFTQNAVVKLCGYDSKENPLISLNEIKMIERFEAIISMPRTNPIKLKLIPDYENK